MDETDDTATTDLIARLFDLERGGPDVGRLMASRWCAHHLAPVLEPIASCRGLANEIFEILACWIEAEAIDMSAQHFRNNASKSTHGLTLDVILKMFMIVEEFLRLRPDMPGVAPEYVKVRQKLLNCSDLSECNRAVVTPSTFYVEVAEATKSRGSVGLIPLPAILARLGLSFDDIEEICLAADPACGQIYEKAHPLLHGLKAGYDGYGDAKGACKLTLAAAKFLHTMLQQLAAQRGKHMEPFKLVFNDAPKIGPRKGQATRSLSLGAGNFIEPFKITMPAAA